MLHWNVTLAITVIFFSPAYFAALVTVSAWRTDRRMGKGSSAANSQGNVKPFTPVEGPAAWYAKDYKNDVSWIYRLTDGDIKEVEAALEVAKASGKEIKVR